MNIVIINHNFAADTYAVTFKDYDLAKKYFDWICDEYLKAELNEGSHLDMDNCFRDEEYGRITWDDGCFTEFILSYTIEPEDEFKEEYCGKS